MMRKYGFALSDGSTGELWDKTVETAKARLKAAYPHMTFSIYPGMSAEQVMERFGVEPQRTMSDGTWLMIRNYLIKHAGEIADHYWKREKKESYFWYTEYGYIQPDAVLEIEGAALHRIVEMLNAFDVQYWYTRDEQGVVIPRSMQG